MHFYENCSHSPASRLAQQATIEIGDIEGRGFHDRTHASPIFTGPCVAAIDEDGRAIGFIIYDCDEESWNITLSYVVPEHRRKHINTALFYALCNKAIEQGNVFSIDSGTNAKNLAAQAAFEAQGRTKEHIMYSYSLKDRGDGKEPTESAVAQSRRRSFEEMSMPEYLVEPFDTGPEGLESMQVFINEKAAEGYALAQAVPREDYHWVLFFKR
ncbi:GNAT family N-acetyltransferase [Sinorhizobium meliloti]|nr:GNAT family N-acetyltransferase [Sinorhizobium meliloti]